LISGSYASPLGINEIVAYETINRNLSEIWDSLDLLRQMLDVRKDFSPTDICWIWKKHVINDAQNTNSRVNPYSWYELRADVSARNPLLSGITWETAVGCQEEVTVFPICFNWTTMGSNCLYPVTWAQLQEGGKFGLSWTQLAEQCCVQPSKLFDKCNIICK